MSFAEAFHTFWAVYPHRVGRFDAEKALKAALKLSSLDDIVAGVEDYVRTKPDWQAWKGPGAWLRAGRWMDEPAEHRQSQTLRHPWDCPHSPICPHRAACAVVSARKVDA